MGENLLVRSRGSNDELRSSAALMEDEIWSPMGFLSATEAHKGHYERILDDYADFQLCLIDEEDGRLLALANCVPAYWDFDRPLPPEGWDWLVGSGGRSNNKPNLLGGLAISVPAALRGRGYAQRMLREMKALGQRSGLDTLVVPVRPSAKHRHPLVPMRDYVHWTDERGRCFDPWLRSHFTQGARFVDVCDKSMVVDQHIAFWETWTGRRFTASGRYILEDGLVPLEIDLETQSGRYVEPNVWVAYDA